MDYFIKLFSTARQMSNIQFKGKGSVINKVTTPIKKHYQLLLVQP